MALFQRQTTGSVVCPSCGKLVAVKDETCWNCGRRNPGMWGFTQVLRRLGQDMGFVQLVIGACIVLYIVSLMMDPREIFSGGLFSLLAPSSESVFRLGASGLLPVFGAGRWWTVLSAGWLHGGLLHILFNMLWVRQLAPAVAELYGPGRMIIIYNVSSLVGFVMSSCAGFLVVVLPPFLAGARLTVGASAAIFGLLGALVWYGRRSGSRVVRGQALYYAGFLFVLGVLLPGVDNWAHLGGFLGGYVISRWLDPLQPERIDHVLIAVVSLAATAIAILVSVLR